MEVRYMIDNKELTDNIQFLAKSEIRLKILGELQKQPLSIKEIVKKTKITYSSVSNNISKLEKNNHVKKIRGKYEIKPLTRFYFKTLVDFKESIDLIIDFKDLWNMHKVDQLSLESIQNINDLQNSRLVETTPVDIYKPHNIIKEQMLQSENVKAIFPYLHPEYPKLVEKILKNGGSVELILPKIIFRETIFNINPEIRKKAVKNGKLKVFAVSNDVKLCLIVCDENMSLGLFKNDDSFDQNRILISDDKKAKKWACDLFEYSKNNK